MFTRDEIIWAFAAPAILALVVTLIGWIKQSRFSAIAGAFALGGAIFFGVWKLLNQPVIFPPAESGHWIFTILAGVTLLSIVLGQIRINTVANFIAMVLMMAGAFSLYFLPRMKSTWSPAESSLWVGSFAVISSIALLSTERFARRNRGFLLPLCLSIIAIGVGQLIMLRDNATLGKQAITVGATLAGITLATLLRPAIQLSHGPAMIATAMLCLVLGRSMHFASVPVYAAVLCVVSVLLIWTVHFPLVRTRGRITQLAITLLAIALPLSAAIFPAVMKFIEESAKRTTDGY